MTSPVIYILHHCDSISSTLKHKQQVRIEAEQYTLRFGGGGALRVHQTYSSSACQHAVAVIGYVVGKQQLLEESDDIRLNSTPFIDHSKLSSTTVHKICTFYSLLDVLLIPVWYHYGVYFMAISSRPVAQTLSPHVSMPRLGQCLTTPNSPPPCDYCHVGT